MRGGNETGDFRREQLDGLFPDRDTTYTEPPKIILQTSRTVFGGLGRVFVNTNNKNCNYVQHVRLTVYNAYRSRGSGLRVRNIERCSCAPSKGVRQGISPVFGE